jgi:hypothetical protein
MQNYTARITTQYFMKLKKRGNPDPRNARPTLGASQ